MNQIMPSQIQLLLNNFAEKTTTTKNKIKTVVNCYYFSQSFVSQSFEHHKVGELYSIIFLILMK